MMRALEATNYFHGNLWTQNNLCFQFTQCRKTTHNQILLEFLEALDSLCLHRPRNGLHQHLLVRHSISDDMSEHDLGRGALYLTLPLNTLGECTTSTASAPGNLSPVIPTP